MRGVEYNAYDPYDSFFRIIFKDELEEIYKKLKSIKVTSFKRKEKKYILNVVKNVLGYMKEYNVPVISMEWW